MTTIKKPTEKMLAVLAELAKPQCVAHYMRYMGRFNPHPYYFLSSTMKHCTTEIRGLQARGLVERIDESKYCDDHKCVINADGRKLLRSLKHHD